MSADPSRGDARFTLTGATIVTMNPEREVLRRGYVTIRNGVIEAVAPGDPEPGAGDVRHLPGRVILPGFVNTHAHLVSVLTRGLGGDRFLTGGVPGGREMAHAIREALDHDTAYAGARLALTELMLSGVTTTTESYAARRGLEDGLDGVLRAWNESGLRGTLYRASVDRTTIVPEHRHDSPDVAVSELDRLRRAWSSELVAVGAEAMALHRVSPELFAALRDWAVDRRAPFAMHISYTEEAADYPVREHGARLMAWLEEEGALDAAFLGYHPIWLSDEEIAVLARSNAGVSVCAPANMLIGLAAAPLPELLEAGVRAGLGTDQPNDGHNFFEVMKATLLQQRIAAGSTVFGSPELMLELATVGGARALHLEDRIGSIEEGKRADLVVLDARRTTFSPEPGRISDIVYAASPADVEAVLVDGRFVVEHGRAAVWDQEEVSREADRAVSTALEAAGLPTHPLTTWAVVDADGREGPADTA